ncbi:MAG: hypothetical protein DCC75_07795 [Proteobacteria bacterium]|nr:MAG: hypothetical protein DCC75_07795 [Pseudomonadota bacterium]
MGAFTQSTITNDAFYDSIELRDMNRDGKLDLITSYGVRLGNGTATFGAEIAFSSDYLQDQEILDLNGEGTFRAGISYHQSMHSQEAALADLNGDGVNEIITAGDRIPGVAAGLDILTPNAGYSTDIGYLDLRTAQGALAALSEIETILARITNEIGSIGASQSRIQVALNNLAATRENSEAAANRILNADVAQESATLVSRSILQQTAASVLAQANQQPALVLQLLN